MKRFLITIVFLATVSVITPKTANESYNIE